MAVGEGLVSGGRGAGAERGRWEREEWDRSGPGVWEGAKVWVELDELVELIGLLMGCSEPRNRRTG